MYFNVSPLWRQNDAIHEKFWWIWIQGLKIALSAKFELDQVITLKIIQVSKFLYFSSQKMMWQTENKRLPGQHLIKIVFDKKCKMTIKDVKLKSESYFLISYGVLELWRKILGGGGRVPQCSDRFVAPQNLDLPKWILLALAKRMLDGRLFYLAHIHGWFSVVIEVGKNLSIFHPSSIIPFFPSVCSSLLRKVRIGCWITRIVDKSIL